MSREEAGHMETVCDVWAGQDRTQSVSREEAGHMETVCDVWAGQDTISE